MAATQDTRPPRGRLAPTPSGLLHLGNARTFLATWLSMRKQGGEVILRIEDIDRGRSRQELESEQLRDLEWLGLTWDGPLIRQSDRLDFYREGLERLQKAGLAYPCVCTRKEIAASAPHEGEERQYQNTCRGRFSDESSARSFRDAPVAFRFQAGDGTRSFEDLLAGSQTYNTQALVGDFQIFTKDGWPSYQLAVAMDDAAMGVTEVVRGRDLLASTTRQIELAEALSLIHASRWAHLGLAKEGAARLAKRDDARSLKSLREAGVDAEALLGLLGHSLGLIESPSPKGLDALLAHFDWAKLGPEDLELPWP